MYLNALTSKTQTECEAHTQYANTILNVGDAVLNNADFGTKGSVNRFEFIKAKILSRFDNNISLRKVLYRPRVIKELILNPSPLDKPYIINNITQEINNYYPDSGELIEDQW